MKQVRFIVRIVMKTSFVTLVTCLLLGSIWSQQVENVSGPDQAVAGRRGDILNLDDVDDQITFNIDNGGGSRSGRGGFRVKGPGKSGPLQWDKPYNPHGKGGGNTPELNCEQIWQECQCDRDRGRDTKGGKKGSGRNSVNPQPWEEPDDYPTDYP